MFTDDKIAAAQIARIFGSELLNVQQSARMDSGSVPDIVKLDPKQFLMQTTPQQDQAKQQQLLASLQREAEAAYPLPEPQLPPAPVVNASPVQAAPLQSTEIVEALKDISSKIETLSNSILKLVSSKDRYDI